MKDLNEVFLKAGGKIENKFSNLSKEKAQQADLQESINKIQEELTQFKNKLAASKESQQFIGSEIQKIRNDFMLDLINNEKGAKKIEGIVRYMQRAKKFEKELIGIAFDDSREIHEQCTQIISKEFKFWNKNENKIDYSSWLNIYQLKDTNHKWNDRESVFQFRLLGLDKLVFYEIKPEHQDSFKKVMLSGILNSKEDIEKFKTYCQIELVLPNTKK